jgi:hypothetical protein
MPCLLSCLCRSVWLPRVVTGIVLLVGLPLFLRMPLWCDVTLYDVAAANLLDGGVHYRDVFDTNLPGFVWLLTGIRAMFGFGAFPLRCVDLAIVTGVVILVDRLAKRGGATLATRWWAIAGAAVLYLGSVEMVHAQRDIWMALPVLGALVLRLRRTTKVDAASRSVFWKGTLEGALWGVAVWIKPHCLLMAVGVWVVTARCVAGACRRPWAGFTADLLGNLVGGAIVGAAGVAWLCGSGAWPEFWHVVTVWAPEYNLLAQREFDRRLEEELHWFPPWSLWLLPTIPLAVLSLLDAGLWAGRSTANRPGLVGRLLPAWLWDREAGPDARFARGVLAALYLVWAFQSFFIQRMFSYTHLTELFLMFGLWAAHRWAMPAVIILWIALTSAMWLVADANPTFRDRLQTFATDRPPTAEGEEECYFVRHALTYPDRLRNWPDCWRIDLNDRERYALWDRLERVKGHEAVIGWEELGEVAEFLQAQNVKDRELIAWHDSPHALYLMLGIKPGVRYMHINTAQGIGPEAYDRVQSELLSRAGIARFAVSDLEFPTIGETPEQRLLILGPPVDPPHDLLPAALDSTFRAKFPFNQKAVFRSRGGLGRYIVHELTPPLRDTPGK